MKFIIRHMGQDGLPKTTKLEASSKDEAVLNSGIPKSRIQNISVDKYNLEELLNKKRTVPDRDQAITLENLASMLDVGQHTEEAMNQIITNSPTYRKFKDVVAECESVFEYLQVMNFDPVCVAMAKAGSETGNISKALKSASSYLQKKVETGNVTAKDIKIGTIQATLGVSAILIGPLFIKMQVSEITKGMKDVKTNFVSEGIIEFATFLETYYIQMGVLLALCFAVIYFMSYESKLKVWRHLAKNPITRKSVHLKKIKNSNDFLAIYSVMADVNMKNELILDEIIKSTTGMLSDGAALIREGITSGESLYELFDEDYWSTSLISGMSMLQGMEIEQKTKSLHTLKGLAEMEERVIAQQVASKLKVTGMTLLSIAVLMMVIGMYGPILQNAMGGL